MFNLLLITLQWETVLQVPVYFTFFTWTLSLGLVPTCSFTTWPSFFYALQDLESILTEILALATRFSWLLEGTGLIYCFGAWLFLFRCLIVRRRFSFYCYRADW